MVGWSLVFLALSMVAGVLGFGSLGGQVALAGKILFVAFLVGFGVLVYYGRRELMGGEESRD